MDNLTDEQIRELLLHRATTAASQMENPNSPENQKWLAELLATPPDKVRQMLATSA